MPLSLVVKFMACCRWERTLPFGRGVRDLALSRAEEAPAGLSSAARAQSA